ncbi:MAG TPA: hypothetical protein VFV37_01765 [Luteibaculaceae bacterium]|nr:hypothetical protein [Luteibaculaceae bacterium]
MVTRAKKKRGLRLAALLWGASLTVSCDHLQHGEDDHNVHGQHSLENIDFPAVYVVNGGDNTVSVVDWTSREWKATFDLPAAAFPHHIDMSPDGRFIAVAITGVDLSGGHAGHGEVVTGLKVQILDAKTGALVKELPLEQMPHNAAFNRDGTELWIGQSDEVKSTVRIYRTSDWSRMANIAVGAGLSEVTFSPDGNYATASNTESGTVTLINARTKTVIQTLSVGDDPVGAWPARNGRFYVDNEGSRSIDEIDPVNRNLSAHIDLDFKPGYAALHPDRDELWVSDATNGAVVWFVPQGAQWVLGGRIATGADAHAIAFVPAAKLALVTNQGDNTLSIIDADRHEVVKQLVVGSKPNGLVLGKAN